MRGNGPEFFLRSPQELRRAGEISAAIEEAITSEVVLGYLMRLQPPAPSQTTSYMRAPIVKQILDEIGGLNKDFVTNYKGTGNSAYRLTERRPGVIIDTQFDDISYLANPPYDADLVQLTPNCAHRLKTGLEFSAGAMRYDMGSRRMEFVSDGLIGSDESGSPYYRPLDKPKEGLSNGDIVVFTPEPKFDPPTNIFTGSVDGPAGVAAVLGAIKAVNTINRSLRLRTNNVAWTFCDEEEGPAVHNSTFAHGARRMAKDIARKGLRPNAVIVVDGHDVKSLPAAAMYGAIVSGGKGARWAPDITAEFPPYLEQLSTFGVQSQDTLKVGSLSRSNDVGWIEEFRDVIPVGYAGWSFHHVDSEPSTRVDSLRELAKVLAWIAVSAKPARIK